MALLAGLFVVLTFRTIGVSEGDDTFYQLHGSTMHLRDFLWLHYWSPLYQGWFRMFSVVWHDPVACYTASWVGLVLLLLLSPAVLGIRYAWLYAIFFAVYPFAKFSPYNGMFAGITLLLGLCVVLRSRLTYSGVFAAACLTSFCVAGNRSEYDPIVTLCAVLTLVAIALEWRSAAVTPRDEKPTKRLAITAAIVVVLASATMYITAHAQGKRAGMAFAQHYNLRAALNGLMPLGAAPGSNYVELTFGIDTDHTPANGTATMTDFFRAKPKLFLKHVAYNVLDPITVTMSLLLMGVLLYPWLWKPARPLRPASVFLAITLLPPFTELVLIFPRNHYVMMSLPCVVLFGLQAIRTPRLLVPRLWIAPLMVVAMVYLYAVVPRLTRSFPDEDAINKNRILCMRSVDGNTAALTEPVFDAIGFRDDFYVHPRTVVASAMLPKWDDFKAWALKTHPAWITTTMGTAQGYGVTQAQLDSFLQHDLGYVSHGCPTDAYMDMYSAK